MPRTDIELCEHVCRTASNLGWQIDDTGTRWGQSFVFITPQGERVGHGLSATREAALIHACKQVLPKLANDI
jgi:hypothetical protein